MTVPPDQAERVDFATAELFSVTDALWALRDSDNALVPLGTILSAQADADAALTAWAVREGISCRTLEERADALVELRRRNARALHVTGD